MGKDFMLSYYHPRSGNFIVGVNISHSYFHPGGAHITWVKIISHTGPELVACEHT